MRTLEVEITERGYLHVPAGLASECFPNDSLVVLPRERELWLYPTRGAAGGGLLLKQRNPEGDRAVLIWTALPDGTTAGVKPAFWDERQGALRVALSSAGAT